MKSKNIVQLIGGTYIGGLTKDATMGLNSLSRKIAEQSAEDELFESAIRRADDEELRKLARFRMQTAVSKHLD
ncbi:hypothetical protein [Pelagicoccus albus]|uniref:Uncharacterized protein n=1 Tax=Pelagicoccus albus TaxID=415222 RepID=A0A7X1B381_9BACT|nr:hypothetical protein [Pelagicoccus albus]MBC2604831.1 hypothetical protein [Pelagicoccus albus]